MHNKIKITRKMVGFYLKGKMIHMSLKYLLFLPLNNPLPVHPVEEDGQHDGDDD